MKIAAFNVKNLGMKKVNNDIILENLIKIVSRYSLVVMQEVRDPTGKAMEKFLTELNEYRKNKSHPFKMLSSEPKGRNSHKEQFVFFYRHDEINVTDYYQYEEENEDVLAREPFIVMFECPNTVVKNLVLIPVHIDPDDAENELEALDDVVEDARETFETDNIMILGDFNADGRYLNDETREALSISSPPYHWLIDEDADTTTGANDHTYDRIVVYGDEMYDAVVANSAKPFNFQKAYKLGKKMAQSISDHYPVEVELEED
ncbi:deoxyribonuclease-1-like [Neolamprologus brichardi]|uniref:deoxyribonuclease-1-like n=1 Tax=Neolamprologus brichardi TaxID=32507 RepID=UPI0003EC1793|nr:deoxyribonuclease-1-like [Neolamprologus brichardi]